MKVLTPPLLLLALALTGCGTLDAALENRVVCTVDRTMALSVSLYGPIGLSGKVAKGDAAVICALPVTASAKAASAP